MIIERKKYYILELITYEEKEWLNEISRETKKINKRNTTMLYLEEVRRIDGKLPVRKFKELTNSINRCLSVTERDGFLYITPGGLRVPISSLRQADERRIKAALEESKLALPQLIGIESCIGNYSRLSSEEINRIYQEEGVTTSVYNKKCEEYNKKYGYQPTAEEILIAKLFGEDIPKRENKKTSLKQRLSKDSQKKVMGGCLDMLVEETKRWYYSLEGRISAEELYNIILRSLINSARNFLYHSEKSNFRLYAKEIIRANIIEYIRRRQGISYQNIQYLLNYKGIKELWKDEYEPEINVDSKEPVPCSPGEINKILSFIPQYVDYIDQVSSNEFMVKYNQALGNLSNTESDIISLSYPINAPGLTAQELGEYLGMHAEEVVKLRTKAKRKLRKNESLILLKGGRV